MHLKVRSIHGHGDAAQEYVVIDVIEDCDIGSYMLADSTYLPNGNISNRLRHVYWLPDQKVKKGDTVFVWTGVGVPNSLPSQHGGTGYHLHWGLKDPVWNDTGDCAVLLQLTTWTFTPVS